MRTRTSKIISSWPSSVLSDEYDRPAADKSTVDIVTHNTLKASLLLSPDSLDLWSCYSVQGDFVSLMKAAMVWLWKLTHTSNSNKIHTTSFVGNLDSSSLCRLTNLLARCNRLLKRCPHFKTGQFQSVFDSQNFVPQSNVAPALTGILFI